MNLVELIQARNKQYKNVNITCVGLPGSGKSYGLIRLLMRVTGIEDKSVLKYVYFNGEDYVKRLRVDTGEFETLLLDDAGFTFNNREWYRSRNIDFIKELQVARKGHKNIWVSTPHPKLVDSGLGPITHILITLDFWGIGIVGKGNVLKHMIKSGEKGVKEFWKHSGTVKFDTLDEEIAEAYEKKKHKELRTSEAKNSPHLRDIILSKSIEELYSSGLSYRQIARKTGTSANTISKLHKIKDTEL